MSWAERHHTPAIVPPNAALSAIRTLGEANLVERSRVVMENRGGN